MKKNKCGCEQMKVRDKNGTEYKKLLSRLNRVEGQVRGVKKMLEEDRYCIDILIQVSAITSALNAFNKELLTEHIESCVVNDIRAGKETKVDELCTTLRKLMK
ncbi:MAG: metal-sensing transcriptional repressor [Acidaminococcaceae bacterium]|jgi:DNA-binding FrmR family transcriptional regulator|nr:metal-sensing transcriptional repressor [Acidaminococcaceae bacterium]MCI2109619.1 metal-sensing transcriptional repressor [Acidaminococcaceae bacterium]